VFILRIEDTDVERSSQEAVDVILEGMAWLGLNHDEGPFYQMQRMDRYKGRAAGDAGQGPGLPCYMSTAELDALRERQMANKEKPRYDGTWRPEARQDLAARARRRQAGAALQEPARRFGRVGRQGQGPHRDQQRRAGRPGHRPPDGTPTYNFCVVVDDMDMGITHVIRGDDHVNNTPRQINILRALGQEPPVYAHLPTVLNEQGEKMSKRHGAKAVTQYRDEGYLADAIVNYLARLGWSHGDDEIFSRQQLVEWFNLDHLGKSAGQFDEAKLRWVAQQHMKTADDAMLAGLVREQFARHGVTLPAALQSGDKLTALCALFKDRCATTIELMEWLTMYVQHLHCAGRGAGRPVDRGDPPCRARPGQAPGNRGVGEGRDQPGDQGHLEGGWPEDAATGHSCAPAGVWPLADAFGGCRARAVRARRRVGAPGPRFGLRPPLCGARAGRCTRVSHRIDSLKFFACP
jgi:glutamyl-tRNA synthetase